MELYTLHYIRKSHGVIANMKVYVYNMVRDVGFAPNPFGGYCTLATCKPVIRNGARPGDWVIGLGSKSDGNKVVYAMNISEKIMLEQYFEDERFSYKKPIMHGSLQQTKGDNIYNLIAGEWNQLPSHHSNADDSMNYKNLDTDTKGRYVLISELFYYFGKSPVEIPNYLTDQVKHGYIGQKVIKDTCIAEQFIDYITQNYISGIIDFPREFTSTYRYKGR